jgi:hypothetical protein
MSEQKQNYLLHVKFSSLKGLLTQHVIPFLLGSPCTSLRILLGILLGDEIFRITLGLLNTCLNT